MGGSPSSCSKSSESGSRCRHRPDTFSVWKRVQSVEIDWKQQEISLKDGFVFQIQSHTTNVHPLNRSLRDRYIMKNTFSASISTFGTISLTREIDFYVWINPSFSLFVHDIYSIFATLTLCWYRLSDLDNSLHRHFRTVCKKLRDIIVQGCVLWPKMREINLFKSSHAISHRFHLGAFGSYTFRSPSY